MKKHTMKIDEKYSELKQVRISKPMANQVKSKALEQNATESDIIRQALINYINRNLNDSEIIYAKLNSVNQKLLMLEHKIDLLSLISFQQTKFLLQSLPITEANPKSFVESEFEKFKNNCVKSLKENHSGILENWLLDIYEKGTEA